MIDRYAKYLILVIVTGWIIGARECAAATPFTPRHADPVQEFWRWRAVFLSSEFELGRWLFEIGKSRHASNACSNASINDAIRNFPMSELDALESQEVSLFDIVFRWSTRYNQVCLPGRYKSHHKSRD